MHEVGRGLGTPGLITPGSVQRMEQSGLVVEDFRPPQPKQEDFSLEGLPPEARRAFYDQLQIPEGGRVMSARVLSSEAAPPVTASQSNAVDPGVSGTAKPNLKDTAPALDDATQAREELSSGDKQPFQPKANPLTRDLESSIDRAPAVEPSPAAEPKKTESDASPVVLESSKGQQPEPTKSDANALQKSDAGLPGEGDDVTVANDRFAKQQSEIETILAKVLEQNAAMSSQLNAISERLTKLEQANVELEKKLGESKLRGKNSAIKITLTKNMTPTKTPRKANTTTKTRTIHLTKRARRSPKTALKSSRYPIR